MPEEPKIEKAEPKRNMAITPIMNSGMTLIPSEWEWNSIEKQMKMLAKVGMLPKKFYGTTQKPRSEEQAIIAACNCAMSGREMGIAPRTSLRLFNYIDDEESLGVQGMLSQIYSRCKDARIHFLEMTDERCTIEAKRYTDDPFQKFSFTIKDAETEIKGYNEKNAKGEWKKPNWRTMPKKMLKARTVSDIAHSLFSDVINGIYTDEEVADFTTTEVPVGETPQFKREGIIIPTTATKSPPPPPVDPPAPAKTVPPPPKDAEIVPETKKAETEAKTQIVGFAPPRRSNVPAPPVDNDEVDGIPNDSDSVIGEVEQTLKQPTEEDK